ncbi:MAG: nucleotidyltransferase domain-containing protein [Ghiorsea sp.]|nr:nucleotidyltransferase domain-containing protein [Ghiorsea sp.]
MAKQALQPSDIQAMVDTIVQTISPTRIILFGSYAKGNATQSSDIDLCIIEKDAFNAKRSRRKETAKLYKALSSFAIPKDLLLFSEEELNQEKNQHLLHPIQQQGKVLYEST